MWDLDRDFGNLFACQTHELSPFRSQLKMLFSPDSMSPAEVAIGTHDKSRTRHQRE